MKKTWLIPSFLLSFSLLCPIHTVSATNTSYAGPIYALTDEVKTDYFKVTVHVTDANPTPYPFNKVRDDYLTGQETSTIYVPSANAVSPAADAVHTTFLLLRDMPTIIKDSGKNKHLKIELVSETDVQLKLPSYPLGIGENTWLKVGDNITIDGTDASPMLTNIKESNANPYATPGYQPYRYNSNIVIEGGIWDSNRDEHKAASEGFTLGNASNVLVRNVTIKDVAWGHAIDTAGVNGLVIENNKFLGSAKLGVGDRDYNEAIQLDQMASDNPFGGKDVVWGYFDGSVTKNVTIKDNLFGGNPDSQIENSIPWQVGIGSHSIVKNVPYENIVIENNTFDSMSNAGIRMTNYKDVLVEKNTFKNNNYGIKMYSTNYAYDYSNKVAGINVKYPAINDSITIQNNTFDNFKTFGVHINSYNAEGSGVTKNVKVLTNSYINSNLLNAFYQYFAQNTQLLLAHYDINGYILDKTLAANHTSELQKKGMDANYQVVFKDQLYRVSIPTRFTSKGVADYTAYLIKKNTGTNAIVKAEPKGKYYVYTDYILGAKRAKEIETIIEKNMQYTYSAYVFNAEHPNNLYRVGLTKRFTTYAQAKKASDDFSRIAKASSVITQEAPGKYYVRTSSLVGKTRAEQVRSLMKSKTTYGPFSYNTNQMAYYQITVHPFFGKTNTNNQALHLKNTYNWIESIPALSTN